MTATSVAPAVRVLEPCRVGPLELPNRIAMAPMSQHAAADDGAATRWHLVHYGARALGGCGLVMVEDTAVLPDGRISRGGLGAWERRQLPGLGEIAAFCRAHGAVAGVQLAHAGPRARDAAPGALIAASAQQVRGGRVTARAASAADLRAVVAAFGAAARRVRDVGFDVVEVHATYGSLLHQFLSPLTNRRADALGGSLAARARPLLDVVEEVADAWPSDRLLAVRLPARDGDPGGLDADDVAVVAAWCAERGAELIAVAGGLPSCVAQPDEADHVAAVRAIGARTAVAVSVGGGIARAADAERLLAASGATLATVGRPLLTDPYWTLREAGR